MADDIAKLIAAINPDRYYDGDAKQLAEFKRLIKQEGILEASKKAKPKAAEEHQIIYDSNVTTLEPVYFWVLDLANQFFGGKVEKLIDNFASTPGSGHFAELGQRATVMQQQAQQLMGQVNTVLRSILNLIYDLKEFQIRLSHYNAANSKDREKARAALLSLKQIWMDNVDIKRGNSSIKAMSLAGGAMFVTLIDAFLVADTLTDVKKLDLNDRVKRILEARLQEFIEWRKRSETELRKRYEIEKTYLKSQVNAIQLYSRWAKPYLKAAADLEMKEYDREPALVKVFNTILLELSLLGRKSFDFEEAVVDKEMPYSFRNYKLKREYFSCALIDFRFRGIPQKVSPQQAHYAFGGRAEVKFRAYSLNQDELDLLNALMKDSDIEDVLKLVSGMTDDSLKELKADLDSFLKEEEKPEEKAKSEDVNPFSALFGFGEKKEKEKEKTGSKAKEKEKEKIEKMKKQGVGKDNWIEHTARELAENRAMSSSFKIFDLYKKAHDMASHPDPFKYWNVA